MPRTPSINPSIEHIHVYRRIGDKLGMPERRRRPDTEDGSPPDEGQRLREMSFNQMAKLVGVVPTTVTACIKSLEEAQFE